MWYHVWRLASGSSTATSISTTATTLKLAKVIQHVILFGYLGILGLYCILHISEGLFILQTLGCHHLFELGVLSLELFMSS